MDITSRKKQLQKTIRILFTKLRIKPVGRHFFDFNPNHHTFYTLATPQKTKQKQIPLLFFKMLIANEPYKQKTFLLDYLGHQFFAKNNILFTPTIIKANLQKKPFWMIRHAVSGKQGGSRVEFSQNFYRKNTIQNLEKTIYSLQSFTPSAKKFFQSSSAPLKEKKSAWFRYGFQNDYDFSSYFSEIRPKFLTKKLLKKTDQFFMKNKNLLDSDLRLTHGDIHGENLFLSEKGVVLIDWENIHLNNRLFDWGYVWTNGWNCDGFRKTLASKIIRNPKDNKLFLCNQIRWLVRLIGLLDHGTEKYQKTNPQKYRKFKKIRDTHLTELYRITNQKMI